MSVYNMRDKIHAVNRLKECNYANKSINYSICYNNIVRVDNYNLLAVNDNFDRDFTYFDR